MKTSKIYLALVAAAGLFTTACNDLDQMPNSDYATESQKQDAVKVNPSLASAAVNSLPEQMNSYMSSYGTHIDYGWASMMLMMDSRGIDMPSALSNYQWYSAALSYEDFGGRYYDNLYYWDYCYKIIRSSNTVIAAVVESDNPELQYYRGQGLAFRAFGYFALAQMYAFTYERDENALCVPMILDTNMDEVALNGCARATVAQVYAQVINDLTQAIRLLTSAAEAGYTRQAMQESQIAKTFVSPAVAYGLRARANLFSCKYTAAAEDAAKAVSLAAGEGCQPYSRTDVAVPAFNSLTHKSYMWGCYADAGLSEYRGVANWASFLTGFQTNGYAGAGVYRCINKKLYASIPASDVRHGWWLDANKKAPSSLPADYLNFITSGYKDADCVEFPAYATIKFGGYNNAPAANGAIDAPFMRVEEMLLIEAEATGKSNPAEGASKLTTFVKTYRDPSYSFSASSFEDLREEIWRQRRIEFWGEGLAYWDLKRLQKNIDRRGGGFDPTICFNIDSHNTCILFDIPQSEIQRNPLIVDGQHGSSVPLPVDDEE